jgi:SpoVK/Ycf46/Vps4 family AAA+-type ATPase
VSDAVAHLITALRTGGVFLATNDDESRCVDLLQLAAEQLGRELHVWTLPSAASGAAIETLLDELDGSSADAVWVLLDPAAVLDGLGRRRRLRDVARRSTGPAVVLLTPTLLDVSALPEVTRLDIPDPDVAELAATLRAVAEHVRGGAAAALLRDAAALAEAGIGLSRRQFRSLLRSASESSPAELLPAFRRGKARLELADGMLESADAVPDTELGGLEDLKRWLARRAIALRPEARVAAIPPPRGMLLVGVQGCGKSLAARVAAHVLGIPLLRLDPGRLFGSTLGETEGRLRRVLATAERLAPVVLWLDEIDKGLAGSDGTASDAGTTARVVGALLTWLQERQRPVFVVATANRVQDLPPELVRRGRLDEVFFVDLPDADARERIAVIHLEEAPLRRYGAAPPLADSREAFARLARSAEGWSGAELEAALVEARLDAFAQGRPLAAADFAAALARGVPLSRTYAEDIAALRAWARTRARHA